MFVSQNARFCSENVWYCELNEERTMFILSNFTLPLCGKNGLWNGFAFFRNTLALQFHNNGFISSLLPGFCVVANQPLVSETFWNAFLRNTESHVVWVLNRKTKTLLLLSFAYHKTEFKTWLATKDKWCKWLLLLLLKIMTNYLFYLCLTFFASWYTLAVSIRAGGKMDS